MVIKSWRECVWSNTYLNLPMADRFLCALTKRILVPIGYGAMCDQKQDQNVVMDLRA